MIDLPSDTTPLKKTIWVMRIIWAALLFGECMFLAVVSGMILPNQQKPVNPPTLFIMVAWAMSMIPAAFAIRAAIFKKSRKRGSLGPAAYSTGNIVFWAACDAVAFFSLVAAISLGSLWPTILVAAIAMSLQIITFPTAAKLA